MSKPNEFLIHDNGGRPFKVVLHNSNEEKKVDVFIGKYDNTQKGGWIHTTHWKTFEYDEIFIGQGTYDSIDYCDFSYGNAAFVRLKSDNPLQYVYIGSQIVQFTSQAMIETFVSTVGNSDVPYSYAKDVHGGHYFFQGQSLVDYVKTPLPDHVAGGKPGALYGYFYDHYYGKSNKDCIALNAILLHGQNI